MFLLQKKHTTNKVIFISLMTLLIIGIVSCNPTKRIPEAKYLLNTVAIKSNSIIDELKINKEELMTVIKQKPNKTLLFSFGPRFYLYMYNLGDNGRDNKFRNWLKYKVGEEPVLIDSFLTNKSSKQMQLYLKNKGYFLAQVNDTTIIKGKKANVIYTVAENKPYTIRNYEYKIDHAAISELIKENNRFSLIKKGQNFDVDILERERERITRLLKNSGYYFFGKEYLEYDADSNLNNYQIDVSLKLIKLADSTNISHLKKYVLNNIYVDLDYNPKLINYIKSDTEYVKGYQFVFNGKYYFTKQIITRSIFFQQGDYYNVDNVENSYKSFADLRTFKFINIQFYPDKEDSLFNYLNCTIQLTPSVRKSFEISADGTNTAGNLGFLGAVKFQNINAFRGGEIFEVKLRGGIESQVLLQDSTQYNLKKQLNFNTVQIAPELSFSVPKIIFFGANNLFPKRFKPKTTFNASFNYQRRPDYTRRLFNLSYNYSWRPSAKITHTFSPVDINYVDYTKSDKLNERLNDINDERLLLAFQDIFITSMKYAFIFNGQTFTGKSNFSYLKASFESAGLITYLLNSNNALTTLIPNDTNEFGKYQFFADKSLGNSGNSYANYSKIDLEYKYYKQINKQNTVVSRLLAGLAIPYWNSGTVLPYTASYFAGGVNDLRAWNARTIGPGTFSTNSNSLNRIGDLKLEGNIEYRYPIYKFLKGALFTDAGNIWLANKDTKRSGGAFKINNFYSDVALGGGLGLRLDFTYFIIRFDAATILRDPEMDAGKRWTAQHIYSSSWNEAYIKEQQLINPNLTRSQAKYPLARLNFGIGYPF